MVILGCNALLLLLSFQLRSFVRHGWNYSNTFDDAVFLVKKGIEHAARGGLLTRHLATRSVSRATFILT